MTLSLNFTGCGKEETAPNPENEIDTVPVKEEGDNGENEVSQQETSGSGEEEEEIDTSNWKTYRNEEFGFEIKYPKDWEAELVNRKTVRRFSIEKDVPRTILLSIRKEYGDPALTKKYSSIAIQFTDWFDITKDCYGENAPGDMEMETVIIGGKKAIMRKDDLPDYQKGCSGFAFTFKPAPPNWGEFNITDSKIECEDAQVAKEIINSIRFLDS